VTLKERIAADVSELALNTGEFATAGVTYTPDGGDAVTISVVFGAADETLAREEMGETLRSGMTVVVSRGAAEGVANPATKDEMTIGGDAWVVDLIERQDDYVSVLHITRKETGDRKPRTYDHGGE